MATRKRFLIILSEIQHRRSFLLEMSSRSCTEEDIEKMTSEEEVEAKAQRKVTAFDRLQMVSFLEFFYA